MGAPPGDMGGWRGGPAYRGAPAPECLNGGYWKGAPLMRATHLFAIANRVIE